MSQYQNPYSSPQHSPNAQHPHYTQGPISPRNVDVGDVINYAWGVWKNNLGLLIGVGATVIAISLVVYVFQQALQYFFISQKQPEIGMLLGVITGLIGNVIQIYLSIGQTQINLKLLRNQHAEFLDLFGGGGVFLPVLITSFLAGIAVTLGFMMCLIPGIILTLLFWPYYFLIVDQKTTALESFATAKNVAQPNMLTTFVMWLASMAIMLVGLLALGIGVIFAAPLVAMMWSAAYLMMSGQLAPLKKSGY